MTNQLRILFLSLAMLAAVSVHAAAETADAIYLNGTIYTVDHNNPWSEAVAIRDGQWPEEALPLAQVLEIYTINGAKGIRQDAVTGSIEAGKSADMIILNQNLFEIEPELISETQVVTVLFEGEEII